MRIEPPVSVPIPTAQTPAGSSAADPPEEPPDVRAGSRGLRVSPTRGLAKPAANSRHCAVANTSAPAARSRATSAASPHAAGGGRAPRRVEPLVGGEQVQVLLAAGPRSRLDRGDQLCGPPDQ